MATTTTRAGGSRPKPNLELLKARIQKGLSRNALGYMAGLSEKQVGLIERGVATHSRAETLARIANALEADVFDLFPLERRFRR
jgi:transcriptional regulator with XRE-family HTH domain